MVSLQEYFNQNKEKDTQKIFLEGAKIGKVEGSTLIIDDFKRLEYIYISDLPNLTKLTIKDCGELTSVEIKLDKKIEIDLSNCPKFNNLKNTNNNQNPIIIYQDKDKGLCWNCILIPFLITGFMVLGVITFYLINRVKVLNEFVRELQKKLMAK